MVWRNSTGMQLWQSTFAPQVDPASRILAASSRYDTANWMSQLAGQDPTFGRRGLGQMVLLGTHDAGMYFDVWDKPSAALGRTQDQSIFGQLMGGVRYFDLRVTYALYAPYPEAASMEFMIAHGPLTGPLFTEVLSSVSGFMGRGGKEVVVLKLSHMDITQALYAQLASLIASKLGTWLYTDPFAGRLAAVPYEILTRSGGKVIVVVDDDYAVNTPTRGIYVYRDATRNDTGGLRVGDLIVYDAYSNTTDYATMMADQQQKFSKYTGKCGDNQTNSDMFLLSWTLTPVTGVWWWAQGANARLQAEVTASRVGVLNPGSMINVVYLDYYEYASTDTQNVLDYAIGLMK